MEKKILLGVIMHIKNAPFVFPLLGKIEIYCISKENKKILLILIKRRDIFLNQKANARIKFLTKNTVFLLPAIWNIV